MTKVGGFRAGGGAPAVRLIAISVAAWPSLSTCLVPACAQTAATPQLCQGPRPWQPDR